MIFSKITYLNFLAAWKRREMVLHLIGYILFYFFFLEWKICYLFDIVNVFYLWFESTAVNWHPAIKYLDLLLCAESPFSNAHWNISFEPILNSVASK